MHEQRVNAANEADELVLGLTAIELNEENLLYLILDIYNAFSIGRAQGWVLETWASSRLVQLLPSQHSN